jgi:hypothetical protein
MFWTSMAIISVRERHELTCKRGSGSLARATITNNLPVIGWEPGCCMAGSVILNVMLDAAAVADSAKLKKRQAIESLVQRRSKFMVSPES